MPNFAKYLDSFSVLLTSLEMSGSILIFFSDSSKTLIAFMHSVLLILTSEGSLSHSLSLLTSLVNWKASN